MENINKIQRSPDANEGGGNNQEKVAHNLEIIKTFKFHDDNESFVESLKKSFENLDIDGLENSAFVNFEIKTEKHNRQDYFGTDVALDIARRGGAEKILVYAFSDLELIRKNNPKIDLLLANEQVRFLRLPFTPEDAIKTLRGGSGEQIRGEQLQEVQDKEINQKVGQLLHYISEVKSPEDFAKAQPERLEKTITEAKSYFPALEGKTDKEIVEFLFQIRQNVPEVMKGQNIEGVFCDIEGTLFDGEVLNQDTLNKLKEFESQGKNITLWTDGDVNQLRVLLEKNSITYPLKSKIDHAGASAEIVIDNDDQNTFSAKTKIFAKKFIKI